MSTAYRCEVCDGDPLWTVTRSGDVVLSWACGPDLSVVCDRLQRDFEVTELTVTHYAKRHEVAEINRMIRTVMPGAADNGEPEDSISRGIADVEAGRIKRLDWITDEGAE